MISTVFKESIFIKKFSEVKNLIKDSELLPNKEFDFQILCYNIWIDEIVQMMISKFTTVLMQPEHSMIKQLDKTDSFYLIAKDSCQVKIINEK